MAAGSAIKRHWAGDSGLAPWQACQGFTANRIESFMVDEEGGLTKHLRQRIVVPA
jgi:hypothetical protein